LPKLSLGDVMAKARFQSFEESATPAQGGPRLAALRAALQRRELDGFVVPRTDEHQSEYVAPAFERLAWLTGFTGSWGMAIVLLDAAAIFVDGRYSVQVREQVDGAAFAPEHLIDAPPERWLEQHLKPGARLGYDPSLHTQAALRKLEAAAQKVGARMVAVADNPIDAIWTDRPAPPLAPVVLHAAHLAGESAAAKLARLQDRLAAEGHAALLLSDPHALAWSFNIRGGDIAHTPLPLGYAVVPAQGRPTLFLDGRKLSNAVRSELETLGDVREPAALDACLASLGERRAKVLFDPGSAGVRLPRLLEQAGGSVATGPDPVALMKAVKNPVEIAGARAAHRRDGAAMTNFLAWLAREAAGGGVSEMSAAVALEDFRVRTGRLKDVSFPSISAAGPNAALPHYRVTEQSNRSLTRGIYLIDSGGQYEDGTTDITRTIAIGEPDDDMRDRFTRVLKGHIAIATAVFPKGVSGAQLDSFARRPLWEAGLDFDHGTGHGVGSYLSVHEGPQRIAKVGTTPLEPGMILSNEPGYYKAGAWGIRIENLILVEARHILGAEREMLGFETLSFAPIDLALVEPTLLTLDERAWLNSYHTRVRDTLMPLVYPETRIWLEQATRIV
jgi:Xaa-Pro aminopeptidase